jgi:eukaryotic-like serine/threonine-protein kinase
MSAGSASGRWLLVEDLFQRALDMDASLRGSFLEHACRGDAELRSEVEGLLASAGKTLEWLRRPVDRAAQEVAFIGRRIGVYVLVRLLGEGGMGRVFLAERADEQYRQLVS